MEPLVGHCRADSGEHPDRAPYRAAIVLDRGVVVRITRPASVHREPAEAARSTTVNQES